MQQCGNFRHRDSSGESHQFLVGVMLRSRVTSYKSWPSACQVYLHCQVVTVLETLVKFDVQVTGISRSHGSTLLDQHSTPFSRHEMLRFVLLLKSESGKET